ncbi:hypothetical protein AVEN_233746-1, partial [Araneus ventricosus]
GHGNGLRRAKIIGPSYRSHLLSHLRTSPPTRRRQPPPTGRRQPPHTGRRQPPHTGRRQPSLPADS